MKKEIHPTYYKDAIVQCACGASFTVGSTQEKIETEICSNCHPFYTGKGKLIDTAGRIEKFKARLDKKQKLQVSKPKSSSKKVSKKTKKAKK